MAFSLSLRRAAGVLNFTRNVLPAAAFYGQASRAADTLAWTVLPPAGKIAPLPAFFSHRFGTNAGGGDDNSYRPCSSLEGERKHTLLMALLVDAPIYQDEHAITFEFLVPGSGKDDIKVSIEDDHLRVVDLKKIREGEEGYEDGLLLMRVCPCWFKARLITANVKHGVVTLVVPKEEGVETIMLRRTGDVD